MMPVSVPLALFPYFFPDVTNVTAIIGLAKGQCNLIWRENLNLRGSYKAVILDYIQEKYPHLLPLYQEIYQKGKRAYWALLYGELKRYAVGIGNIYSDEILLAGRIYPIRPANTLTTEEWDRLASVILERLAFFFEKNNITLEEYLAAKGQDYRNTPFLQVYGYGGEPCPVCGETLCRTVIGGRSSVYCPACQKI